MKYLHLIWAALFRRKTRTILTLVSIIAAFLLFGLLDAVRVSFAEAGQSANGAERLQTGAKLSFIQPLPQSLLARIGAIDGVKDVAHANWFGGAYQDPHNQIFTFAVSDNYLDIYPEVSVDPAQMKAYNEDLNGVLVGEVLVKKYGWNIGDKIPLQSQIFPNKEGSKNWSFNLRGVMKSENDKAFQSQMILLHWKNFDETTPYNRGQVGWYISRVKDVNDADRVAKAIDALSANSDHETKTQTEQAATRNWIKQLADIGLIVTSIMGAVFFTLILLTGNTMMQAVRERTSELAVLKTIGFSNGSVLGMVLAESILLLLLGGIVGIGLVTAIGAALPKMSGGMITGAAVGPKSWLLGLALALAIGVVIGALPALRAMRLNIVDALAGR
ncbi:MAG: FtsX-like permease family protein [Rudaea sp.]|uniref:ABC transporter permease n=1 Tax=unclassified Rudaea TaxID=2627037 RepID=UPI0010F926AD|nr:MULTISPECIES: FtsX-like permease family protein [unclassified Rudaea]MBN8886660.1 FtsX-like permease family protein [Rudaea sp.]MBR0346828.1 FtsX-like permease family protein [Rudaea sp.]